MLWDKYYAFTRFRSKSPDTRKIYYIIIRLHYTYCTSIGLLCTSEMQYLVSLLCLFFNEDKFYWNQQKKQTKYIEREDKWSRWSSSNRSYQLIIDFTVTLFVVTDNEMFMCDDKYVQLTYLSLHTNISLCAQIVSSTVKLMINHSLGTTHRAHWTWLTGHCPSGQYNVEILEHTGGVISNFTLSSSFHFQYVFVFVGCCAITHKYV